MYLRLKKRFGFTLIELLIVVAIMGLLGTVSVGGFYGLKKGMEERGVMQTVDEFIRAAYRRAVIDRVPTAVYFWNETVNDESEGNKVEKLVVVGHAVAVRRAGRLSRVDGQFLVDEFGDLSNDTYLDEEGKEDSSYTGYKDDPGRFLYKVGGKASHTTFARSVIATTTVFQPQNEHLIGQPNRVMSGTDSIHAYAYYVKPGQEGGIKWAAGDPYGFEFAELTLPQNYIFGTDYSTSLSTPERPAKVIYFSSQLKAVEGGTVTVYGQKLDKSGEIGFEKIGDSSNPTEDR